MAVVQSAIGIISGGNLVATFGSNITNGSTLLAFVCANQNVNTITDTRSTSYTQKENVDDSATSGERFHAYAGVAGSGGANTVTVTWSGSAFTDGALIVLELSGRVTSDPVGTRHTNATQPSPGTSGDGVTAGPVTALGGDDVIFCVVDVGALQTSNYAAGTGFTEVAESGDLSAILDMAVYKQLNVSAGGISGFATATANDRTLSIVFSVQSSGGGGGGGAPPGPALRLPATIVAGLL